MRGVRLAIAAGAVAGAALVAPATPATAAPTHVAVLVAGVGQACVPWRSGMTGSEVLTDGGFTVTYRRDGLVLEIDGKGSMTADDTHYWSYWHDTGSGWQYSASGPASSTPAAGTVEGWSYDNGEASAPAPPAASYADICAGRDPSPTPTVVHRSTSAAPRPSTTRSAYAPPPPPPHRSVARSTVAERVRPAPAETKSRPRTSSYAATPTVTASQPVISPRLAAANARQRQHHAADRSAAVPPWGTVLGIAVIALLGGAGWWRTRTRRSP